MNTTMSKGWHHKQEAREKISKAGVGRKPTVENIEKLKEANRNREWTDEQREAARSRKLGVKNTEDQNRKIKENGKYGEENNMWKGNFASYNAMHLWVIRHNGNAAECVDVAISNLPCKGPFEWSNIDHKYRRNLDDYSGRCTRHHRIYDKQHGLTHPKDKSLRFFANAGNIQKRELTLDGLIIER